MTRPLFAALLAGSAAAFSFQPSTARAAAQAPCAPAAMTPVATAIPVNVPGFGYTALKATDADVHLVATANPATPIPLTVGPVVDGLLKIAPTAPLTVGASYQLTFEAFCSYGPYPAQAPIVFTVAPAAPLPTKVGVVQGAPTVSVKDFGTTQYKITANYTLDAEMKPWAAVYQLGVLFDGKAIETKATRSLNGDNVQIDATGWCDEVSAAKPKHDVVLRARLPFATTVETAVTTMDFACPAPNIVTPPPGTPVVRPVQNDGGSTASNGGAAPSGSSGGCSSSPRGATSTPRPFVAIASALGLAALVRRRRIVRARKGGQ